MLAAFGAIAGALLAQDDPGSRWLWLHWLCKPLATALVFGLAWRTAAPISLRYRQWMLGGIALSLAGDVFLMLPQDRFVEGLVAFLFAHICFLVALAGDARFGVRPLALLGCAGYGALNLWSLWPTLPPALHWPVVVYVAVLTCMGGQAIARAWQHATQRDELAGPAWLAACGGVLFMLSDTLLAWNRFRLSLPWASLWVLATYYGALWLLARSVQRAAPGESMP
jgi:uncharacterized membrane protein YhhN